MVMALKWTGWMKTVGMGENGTGQLNTETELVRPAALNAKIAVLENEKTKNR